MVLVEFLDPKLLRLVVEHTGVNS